MAPPAAAQTAKWVDARVRQALAAGSNTELLKALVEAFPGSWFFTRLDATFAHVNQSACDSLGYTRDELMSLTLYDINPSLTPALWNQLLAMGNFTPASVRTLHRRKDGSTFPVEAFGSRIVLGEENVSVSYVVDLSEEAQTRQALAEKEHLLQSLLDNAPVIVWSIDSNGRFQLLEGKALSLLGTGPKQVAGTELAHQFSTLPEMVKATESALRGISVDGIVTLEQHDFEYRYLPQHDATGAVVGATGVAMDVTARRRAERTNLRLTTAIEKADVAVLLLDTTGHIEYANTAFEGVSATAKRGASNQFWPDLISSEEDEDETRAELTRAIAAGTPWRGTIRCQRADLSDCIQQTTLSPVSDDDARLSGFVVISRDVTLQTRTEERLRQIEKMDAVGQLAGGVAHDFNNLLQVMLGNTSLCLAEPLPESVQASLGEIQEAGKRAAALVRQLLTFSRHVGTADSIDLVDLVGRLVPLLRRLLGEHIAIDVQRLGNRLAVWGDSSQLEQVIVNLCVNARDAMPEGGHLQLRLSASDVPAGKAMELGLAGPGRYATLEVEDTGTGMTEEVQRRAFEPFFTTKAPGVGTGLGLATVYGIAKRHGGSVELRSSPGVGTCFRVWLLASHEEGGTHQPTSQARSCSVTPLRILLVEDDVSVLEVTRQFLARAGHDVAVARNGNDAIGIIEAQGSGFDLLLLDAIMPGANGPEVFRRFRSGSQAPVLFVTGYDFDVLASLAPDRSWAMLRKPFDAAALASAITKLVQDQTPSDSKDPDF